MVRADLLIRLVKYGLSHDTVQFRKNVETLISEERAIQHHVLANKLDLLLAVSEDTKYVSESIIPYSRSESEFYLEILPRKKCSDLILPKDVRDQCKDLIAEQHRVSLLRAYNLEPRNRILMVGPPGNGKTSLAEGIAEALSVPLIVVKYDGIVGSYLGETASNIRKVMNYAKSRKCVLFFDEFETLGKERGDVHETGEIKRVVSSLLLQIDSLPSHVVVIGATNHPELLDRAVWRRFQVKIELPMPTPQGIFLWLETFEKRSNFTFGMSLKVLAKRLSKYSLSFAEIEEFGVSVLRQYILHGQDTSASDILEYNLQILECRFSSEKMKQCIKTDW